MILPSLVSNILSVIEGINNVLYIAAVPIIRIILSFSLHPVQCVHTPIDFHFPHAFLQLCQGNYVK